VRLLCAGCPQRWKPRVSAAVHTGNSRDTSPAHRPRSLGAPWCRPPDRCSRTTASNP
jgi:hypothetical protein